MFPRKTSREIENDLTALVAAGRIEEAMTALIPVLSLEELKAANQDQLLQLLDWLGRWFHEIDFELKARYSNKANP